MNNSSSPNIENILSGISQVTGSDQDKINTVFVSFKQYFLKLLSKKDYSAAEQSINSLENLEKSLIFKEKISDLLYCLSKDLKENKLYEKALMCVKKSIRYLKNDKNQDLALSKYLTHSSSIYSKLKNHSKSIKKLTKSLALLYRYLETQNNDKIKNLIVLNLYNLGIEEENLKKLDAAKSRYNEALNFLAENIKNPDRKTLEKISSSIKKIQKKINENPITNTENSSIIESLITENNEVSLFDPFPSVKTTGRSPAVKKGFETSQEVSGPELIPPELKKKPSSWVSVVNTQEKNSVSIKEEITDNETTGKKLETFINKERNENHCSSKEENKKTVEKMNASQKDFKSACVFKSKLDIDFLYFDVCYFIKGSLNQVEISCVHEEKKYETSIILPPNTSIYDFIRTNIEPSIYLENKNIVFLAPQKITLVEGAFYNDSESGFVKVVRYFPRWKVEVIINDKSDFFEMADIKINCNFQGDFTKDPKFFFVFFSLDKKEIRLNTTMHYPFDRIFEGKTENYFLGPETEISIYKIHKTGSLFYLVQRKNESASPLLIESRVISARTERIRPTLNETINFIKKSISVNKNNQLVLFNHTDLESYSSEYQKFILSMENINNKLKKNEVPKALMFANLPGFKEGLERAKKLDKINKRNFEEALEMNEKIIYKEEKQDYSEIYDRILLRTCVIRGENVYQISMNYSSNDMIKFFIRHGSDADKVSTLSIEAAVLCEKTGLSKDTLLHLGHFILRNNLRIEESGICYFDFSEPFLRPAHALKKIFGFFKIISAKKGLKNKLRNLICKKKIKLDGLVYTCLIYVFEKSVYIRLVRGIEVLSLDASLNKLAKDGYMSTDDKLFMNLYKLGLKIEVKDGRKYLIGLDKYK